MREVEFCLEFGLAFGLEFGLEFGHEFGLQFGLDIGGASELRELESEEIWRVARSGELRV